MPSTNFGFSTEDEPQHFGRDVESLDALLWTLFHHDHTAVAEAESILIGPLTRPQLTLLTTGGTIPAGTTFYYRISYVDAFGNETEAGIQNTIATPNPIAPPGGMSTTVQTTGGLLGPGTYRYALAYFQAGGLSTRAPNIFSAIVPVGTNTNQITITLDTLPTGADGWDIYRRDPSTDEYYYLDSVSAGATEYVDDGSETLDCNRLRPSLNTTNSTNRIQVSIDPEDLPLPSRVSSWRIYRTTVGGVYAENSLVATVVDTTTEGGADLVTSYIDEGFAAAPGQPLELTASPPSIPGLDAATAFAEDSGPIPGRLNPWRVSQMHTFVPGQIADATVYNQTHLYEDMTPSRVDVVLLGAPSGVDASNHGIVRVKDTALVDAVHSYWTDAFAINEFQQIVNNSTAGTYTLTFDGQTTTALDWDSTALEIADALLALSNVDDVFVFGTGTSTDPFIVEFKDPGLQDVPQMTYGGGSLTGTLSISTVTQGTDGGTFTLSDGVDETDPISASASAATLKTRLETDITAITTVTVTGTGTMEDPWIVTFTNPAATHFPLLDPDITNLNGIIYSSEVVRGHGNTIINVDLDSAGTYFSWAAPEVISDSEYAVNMFTNGGTEVSDTFAENDLAIELNAQNEYVTWHVGVLEPATYVVDFYVADQDQSCTFEVAVYNINTGTVTSVVELNVSDNRLAYAPAYRLEFTADGIMDLTFQVTKTDTGTDRVRVDRIAYAVLLDKFLAGETLTVEGVIDGTPTNAGEDIQVNVWY